ncbi:MAG: penicillin-binding protein [Bacteroidales bacterium]|nr:penicillin-binding protein [Bacteroidales bacterium]
MEKKGNSDNGKRIGRFLYVIYLFYLVAGIVLILRIVDIQLRYEPDPAIASLFKPRSIKQPLYPERGSILARDGRLLAMSLPMYRVYMDCTVRREEFADMKKSDNPKRREKGDQKEQEWKDKARELSEGLARLYKDKSADAYYKEIVSGRESNKRHLRIGGLVDHEFLLELKKLPLFNEDPNKGGMIVESEETRQYPYGSLARRTIGYVKNNQESNSHIGLEGRFDFYLHGKDGFKWMKDTDLHGKIQNYDSTWVAAENGLDLRTTIDIDIQDIADNAMRNSMSLNPNIYGGCMIVMDVETGGIRAMVNLLRDSTNGRLNEVYNMAVTKAGEPGSVFKVTTLMSLLEDGYVTIDQEIPTNRGIVPKYPMFGSDHYITNYMARTKKDSITIRHCLEISSNYAFRYLALQYYGKTPKKMLDKLYRYKLGDEPMEFDLDGLATPLLPNPDNRQTWSLTDLPSVAIGYTVKETPLHILMFYNAIANGGKMMKPYLVESLDRGPNVVKKLGPTVLNASICSRRTADTLRSALAGVVSNPKGTGHSKLYGAKVPVAGKTGTAQMVIEAKYLKGKKIATRELDGKRQYQATFVGFFPADKPRYSAIVTMYTKPVYVSEAVYGGNNPALAFREIVDNIYAFDADGGEVLQASGKAPKMQAAEIPDTPEGQIPDVRGMGLRDAVYILESSGYTAVWSGTGHVKSQTPAAGSKLGKGQTVQITLK